MSLFGKFDRNFGTNRKMRRCGATPLERATAQLVLLQLSSEHLADLNDGLVSASRAHPEQLAISLASFGFAPEQCDAALDALQAVGIIERCDDGSVHLVRWKEWSTRALTAGERKRRSRDNQGGDAGHDDVSTGHDPATSVTAGNGESQPVTNGHAPSHNVTPAEQGRVGQGRAGQGQAEQSVSRPVTGRDTREAPPPAPPVPGQPAAPEETQSAAAAAPEARSPEVPEVQIADVLALASFGNPIVRIRTSRDLASKGMTGANARELWRLAQAKGDEPQKLLAHWIHENQWRSVIDEQAMKARERKARKRGKQARDAEDQP